MDELHLAERIIRQEVVQGCASGALVEGQVLMAAEREPQPKQDVHVRHEFPTADAMFFAPGSEGAKIHTKVQNLEGEPVVQKHHVNSFREMDLKAILDRHGVEAVVICGAMSHMCVDAGARAASDLDSKPGHSSGITQIRTLIGRRTRWRLVRSSAKTSENRWKLAETGGLPELLST